MTGHELLLRLAGRIPDPALAQARRMLADGAASSAITLVAGLLAEAPIPLTADELAAIRGLARDASALPGVRPVAEPPALSFSFSDVDQRGEAGRDEIDAALVAAAEARSEGLTPSARCGWMCTRRGSRSHRTWSSPAWAAVPATS